MRDTGIKVTRKLLRAAAVEYVKNAENLDIPEVEAEQLRSKYVMQDFCMNQKIVVRLQSGCKKRHCIWEEYYNRLVTRYLGQVRDRFEQGQEESLISNLDETHFVIDQDNGRALGLLGESSVNCAVLSNGTENFTIEPLVRGGINAQIVSVFVIFKNANTSYPIAGVPDKQCNVSYRSGPKGWMDRRLFKEMLTEERFLTADEYGRGQLLFLDNVNSHNLTERIEEVLDEINTSLCHLPPNSTHKVQPLDIGILKLFKKIWRNMGGTENGAN